MAAGLVHVAHRVKEVTAFGQDSEGVGMNGAWSVTAVNHESWGHNQDFVKLGDRNYEYLYIWISRAKPGHARKLCRRFRNATGVEGCTLAGSSPPQSCHHNLLRSGCFRKVSLFGGVAFQTRTAESYDGRTYLTSTHLLTLSETFNSRPSLSRNLCLTKGP